MVVSSYQSVSGAGQPGIHELDEQWTKGAGQADRYLIAGREALEPPAPASDPPRPRPAR